MSPVLRECLTSNGACASRTMTYNPSGNCQVETYGGIIWRGIFLTLESKGLPLRYWQEVLDVLHSTGSLLCTATTLSRTNACLPGDDALPKEPHFLRDWHSQ